MKQFKLMVEDERAIELAEKVCSDFYRSKHISNGEKKSLEKVLDALDMMPENTPGLWIHISITYRYGANGFGEMHSIDFIITEDSFEVSSGGSTYDSSCGSDSYSNGKHLFCLDGYRETGLRMYELEDEIRDYLNEGAIISIEDGSDD